MATVWVTVASSPTAQPTRRTLGPIRQRAPGPVLAQEGQGARTVSWPTSTPASTKVVAGSVTGHLPSISRSSSRRRSTALGRGQLDPAAGTPSASSSGPSAATRRAAGQDQRDQVGQVVLALVVVGPQPGEAVEVARRKTYMPAPTPREPALVVGGVALLDDPGDRPGGVAQHPSVARRVLQGAGSAGSRPTWPSGGAAHQLLQQLGRETRGCRWTGPGRLVALEQAHGCGQGVAGAALGGLDGEADRAEVERLDGRGR